MPQDLKALLFEARECARSDPDRSRKLLLQIAEQEPGTEWAEAQAELVVRAVRTAELPEGVARAQLVLGARLSEEADCAKAIVAVYLNFARKHLDEPLDVDQLDSAAQVCLACEDYYTAGMAYGLAATAREDSGDREAAKAALVRAAELYDRGGSMTSGPGALRRLAKLYIEEGEWDAAADCVTRGLEHLAAFPHGGMNVRMAKNELVALQTQIEPHLRQKP